jgi:hypothetical protein
MTITRKANIGAASFWQNIIPYSVPSRMVYEFEVSKYSENNILSIYRNISA